MSASASARKRVVTFLVLTFALSSVFYGLVISAGSIMAAGGMYVVALMWCPGVAAVATQLLYERSLRGLGWGWGKTRYQLWSIALPFLYALAAYAVVWGMGLGGFYNREMVALISEQVLRPLGLEVASPYMVIAIFTLLAATLGVVKASISAMGEEIGWRGFLVPHLAELTSFRNTALISGAVWAAWHFPLLLFADYNGGTPAWYGLACFTMTVMGTSVALAWLRLRSGSLWTGVFLHASHNVFIQGVFGPLTVDTGPTEYVAGEFGAALALVAVLVGYLYWRKRGELAAPQAAAVRTAVAEREVLVLS